MELCVIWKCLFSPLIYQVVFCLVLSQQMCIYQERKISLFSNSDFSSFSHDKGVSKIEKLKIKKEKFL